MSVKCYIKKFVLTPSMPYMQADVALRDLNRLQSRQYHARGSGGGFKPGYSALRSAVKDLALFFDEHPRGLLPYVTPYVYAYAAATGLVYTAKRPLTVFVAKDSCNEVLLVQWMVFASIAYVNTITGSFVLF